MTKITNVNYTLTNTLNKYTGKTDSNGRITLNDIPSGEYTLTLEKKGYDTVTKKIIIKDNVYKDYTVQGILSKDNKADTTKKETNTSKTSTKTETSTKLSSTKTTKKEEENKTE